MLATLGHLAIPSLSKVSCCFPSHNFAVKDFQMKFQLFRRNNKSLDFIIILRFHFATNPFGKFSSLFVSVQMLGINK